MRALRPRPAARTARAVAVVAIVALGLGMSGCAAPLGSDDSPSATAPPGLPASADEHATTAA